MATFSCVKLWIHQLSLSGSGLDFVVWLFRIMGWYRMLEFINGYWAVFPFLNWTCLSQFFPFGNVVFLLSWPVQFFIFHEFIIDQLTWIVVCVNCLKFYVGIGVNSRGSVRIGLGRKLDFFSDNQEEKDYFLFACVYSIQILDIPKPARGKILLVSLYFIGHSHASGSCEVLFSFSFVCERTAFCLCYA